MQNTHQGKVSLK